MAKITVRRFHLPPFLPRLSLSALHNRLPFVYLTMPRRFAFQEPEAKDEEKKDWTHAYADDLKTEVYTEVNADPKASVHATEWRKIMSGDPVEINPSVGSGLKIMTVDEWTSRWKRNDRCGTFPPLTH